MYIYMIAHLVFIICLWWFICFLYLVIVGKIRGSIVEQLEPTQVKIAIRIAINA